MQCHVCGKEFNKVVEFEGLSLETKDKHYFCSWGCYIEDTKQLYNHVTEVLDKIAAKRAKEMEAEELSEKEIEKANKEKKAWLNQRLIELKLKEPDNPRPSLPDDTKQRKVKTRNEKTHNKRTRK